MQKAFRGQLCFFVFGTVVYKRTMRCYWSGIRNGYSVLGADLIIIPIFSKSLFAYRKVTTFGLTFVTLYLIVSAINAF